eukprot:5211514-Alexandrium_andersonii.AAC.1
MCIRDSVDVRTLGWGSCATCVNRVQPIEGHPARRTSARRRSSAGAERLRLVPQVSGARPVGESLDGRSHCWSPLRLRLRDEFA